MLQTIISNQYWLLYILSVLKEKEIQNKQLSILNHVPLIL